METGFSNLVISRKLNLCSSLLDLVDLVVLTLDTGVGRINLLLQVVLGSLQPVGLVNNVLRKFCNARERMF